jgi:hypothetical protein
MGVVAIEFDGNECSDRLVLVSSASDSAAGPTDTTYIIHERFALTLRDREDYVAFLPAFNYLRSGIDTTFAGIEVEDANVPCVKAVKLLSEFKKEDLLFDFFVPKRSEKKQHGCPVPKSVLARAWASLKLPCLLRALSFATAVVARGAALQESPS